MTITKNLVSSSKYSIKCPYLMTPIGICVHNTANDASAANEVSYMIGNDNQVSFHFAVDDVQIVQGIPLDRNAWHAGDGGSGEGNRKYISIEICYSKSGGIRFDKAENNAAGFIAQLLQERGWGIDRVKKHQDFSGKYCPHRTLDYGWDRFLNKITKGGQMDQDIKNLYQNSTDQQVSLDAHQASLRALESQVAAINAVNQEQWDRMATKEDIEELKKMIAALPKPVSELVLTDFGKKLLQLLKIIA